MKKEYIKPNVVLLKVNSFIIMTSTYEISDEEHKADDSWAKSTSVFNDENSSDYFEEETKLKVQFHDIWGNDY